MLAALDLSLPALHLIVPSLSYRILSLPSASLSSAALPAALLAPPSSYFLQLTACPSGSGESTLVIGSPASSSSTSDPNPDQKDPHPFDAIIASLSILEGGDVEWSGIAVKGPLDLSMVGILSRISGALAEEEVNLYVCSTWETDLVLVPSTKLQKAKDALISAGWTFDN